MGLDRKLQYHSLTGCCICGTKTSSSRFTSSARFESLFKPCFGITFDENQRSGDICNACVLIVKRFRNSPRDSCKNWAHIIGSKVGPGHRSGRRQKIVRHHEAGDCSVRLKASKLAPHRVGLRTPSPMRLRHPKRFTIKPAVVKDGKSETSSKCRSVRVGCGRRSKVFRRRPTRRSLSSFTASNQLIDTDYWKRVAVCCGAVYVSESNDLILIDVSKFKPCDSQPCRYYSLAHLKAAVAQNAAILDAGSTSSRVLASSSTDSLSAQDSDDHLVSHSDQPLQQQSQTSVFSSSPGGGACDDDDDDDSCSVLQTDESMEAASPSQDTDEDDNDGLPTSAAGATRSILCNLLRLNKPPFSKSEDNYDDDAGNRSPAYVWSDMQSRSSVSMWPSSKPSTIKVYP